MKHNEINNGWYRDRNKKLPTLFALNTEQERIVILIVDRTEKSILNSISRQKKIVTFIFGSRSFKITKVKKKIKNGFAQNTRQGIMRELM